MSEHEHPESDPTVHVTVHPTLDPEAPYVVHSSVAVRPEPFGALVYHYGNRKLVFLKSPRMVAVVKSLDGAPSIRAALEANGVSAKNQAKYLIALSSLLASDMIVPCRRRTGIAPSLESAHAS